MMIVKGELNKSIKLKKLQSCIQINRPGYIKMNRIVIVFLKE